MRLLGFMGALLLIGAVGWWATGTPATRTGVVASVLASAAVIGQPVVKPASTRSSTPVT